MCDAVVGALAHFSLSFLFFACLLPSFSVHALGAPQMEQLKIGPPEKYSWLGLDCLISTKSTISTISDADC